MADSSANMKRLLDRQAGEAPDAAVPGGARSKAKATPSRAAPPGGPVPGTPRTLGAAKELAGFDPAVVQTALNSGVKLVELREVRDFLHHGPQNLGDFAGNEAEAAGVGSPGGLSFEADGPTELREAGSAGVAAAVVALTKIVQELAAQKQKGQKL